MKKFKVIREDGKLISKHEFLIDACAVAYKHNASNQPERMDYYVESPKEKKQ